MIMCGLQGESGFSTIHGSAVVNQFSHVAHLAIELGK
jgi:hypothetical protein